MMTMLTLRDSTQAEFRAHAVREFPRECCGLFIVVGGKERYVPCRNIATTPQEHFILSPEDYADAEDLGAVIAVGHSHPNERARPSPADKVMCETSGLPWFIVHVSVPDGGSLPEGGEIVSLEPSGFVAPLIGRPFSHGVLDCYSLIRDWYKQERNIELPDFERRDEWWLHGQDLYMQNFAAAGFAPITGPMQVGDVVLMQIRSPVANHAGVYIGNGQIMHHVARRMSSRDVYDGYWQENTRMVVRYVK